MGKHLVDTEFWHDLMDGIYGARQGGARIIVDAEGSSTGVGKTSCAIYLAELLCKAFDYDLQPEDLTLSGREYLQRWKEHPDESQPSVLILDELAGAGAGDARKATSHQNVNLSRSWQLMRKKRVVTLTTMGHWSDADKRMRRLADYRLYCLKSPIGSFKPYEIGATFKKGDVQPSGYDDVERIHFPDMKGNGSAVYEYLEDRKDELLDSQFFDADKVVDDEEAEEQKEPEQIRREEQIKQALRMVKPWDDDSGISYVQAAKHLDYGHSWIGNRVAEWRDGQHQDLLDASPAQTA